MENQKAECKRCNDEREYFLSDPDEFPGVEPMWINCPDCAGYLNGTGWRETPQGWIAGSGKPLPIKSALGIQRLLEELDRD